MKSISFVSLVKYQINEVSKYMKYVIKQAMYLFDTSLIIFKYIQV